MALAFSHSPTRPSPRPRHHTNPDNWYGDRYQPLIMYDSKRDVSDMLHEEAEARSIRERLRQKQQQQAQQKQNKKRSRDTWER